MNVPSQRLDRWLWFARFFKSRTLATRLCTSGRLRINGTATAKAHHAVRVGDVLTFPRGRDVRVVRVAALGERRGPAPEARTLYDDLEPPQPRSSGKGAPAPRRDAGSGRPTKAERRATDRLRGDA
jgi:ribosome-associated heat shock protein Hsp15